jgi:hypothetical protein
MSRRGRRYLSGVDWMMGTLDRLGRHSTGLGLHSNFVLDLDGPVSETALADALAKIAARFPMLRGRVARDWLNLIPYWHVGGARTTPISLRVVRLNENDVDESDRVLANEVNTPFASESEHVRVTLVTLGERRSRVGLVVDHRLFDAYGAETFLRLIDLTAAGKLDEVARQVLTIEPPRAGQWLRRMRLCRVLNRRLFGIGKTPVCSLDIPPKGARRTVKFVHDALDAGQTSGLDALALNETGVPIVLPSVIARAAAAMHATMPQLPLPGEQYTVFTSAGSRSPARAWEQLFFNHFSILMFDAPKSSLASAQDLSIRIRDQLFDAMKTDFAGTIGEVSMLARLFPQRFNTWLGRFPFHGRLCTLYFACLRETGFTQDTFLGARVENLYHKPLAFSPPGVNLCMMLFKGRFNLVLSYVDGVMTDGQASEMMARFKTSLTA